MNQVQEETKEENSVYMVGLKGSLNQKEMSNILKSYNISVKTVQVFSYEKIDNMKCVKLEFDDSSQAKQILENK